MAHELQAELEVYEREKSRLIAAGGQGKYAVVGDGVVMEVLDTYEDALKVGYRRFGLGRRFMVRKVEAIEGALHFTGNVGPCRV